MDRLFNGKATADLIGKRMIHRRGDEIAENKKQI